MANNVNGTYKRIRGDWLIDGVIDNLGRRRLLDIFVTDGGYAYDSELYGMPEDGAGRLELNSDDELRAWGAGVAFLPDAGELDRIGRDKFASV